jgi:hypothetical protein
MAEMERMTAEEVVRHLLEDEGGADLGATRCAGWCSS